MADPNNTGSSRQLSLLYPSLVLLALVCIAVTPTRAQEELPTVTPSPSVAGKISDGNQTPTPSATFVPDPFFPPIIVHEPDLSPNYSGNICESAWYRIEGYDGASAYLTAGAQEGSIYPISNFATWQTELPYPGIYAVEAYVPTHEPIRWQCPETKPLENTTGAKYTVHHALSSTEISLNQNYEESRWIRLGDYEFQNTALVELNDKTDEPDLSSTVSFSAIRFVPLTPPSTVTPTPTATPTPTETPTPTPTATPIPLPNVLPSSNISLERPSSFREGFTNVYQAQVWQRGKQIADLEMKYPSCMWLNSSEIVQVRLALQKPSDYQITIILSHTNGKSFRTQIPLSSTDIEADLSSPGFDIELAGEEERPLDELGYTEWIWNIRPYNSGQYRLIVSLTQTLDIPHTGQNPAKQVAFEVWVLNPYVIAGIILVLVVISAFIFTYWNMRTQWLQWAYIRTGITGETLIQLRQVLIECEAATSERQVQNYFVDSRLSIWRPRLPESDNEAERVDTLIRYLHTRYDEEGRNGLVLLLKVLLDRSDSSDLCSVRIERLLTRLQNELESSADKDS